MNKFSKVLAKKSDQALDQNAQDNIFKKISKSDKKNLLQKLIQDKIPLLVKGEEEKICSLVAIEEESRTKLKCKLEEGSPQILIQQAMIISVSIENERYFFKSFLHIEKLGYFLDIDDDIFQLQRRKAIRLQIPSVLPQRVQMTECNGQKISLDCKILNLSSGGMKLKMDLSQISFVPLDKIRIDFSIAKKIKIELDLEIKHIAKDLQNPKDQILGAQFINYNKASESKIMLLMMDLQHEIFIKYAKC